MKRRRKIIFGLIVILLFSWIFYYERDIELKNEDMEAYIQIDGVELIAEKSEYGRGTNFVTFTWVNDLEHEVIFGDYFTLERFNGDDWVSVSSWLIRGVDGIGYAVEEKGERDYKYQVSYYAPIILKSHYRIHTSCRVAFEDDRYEKYDVFGYFDVK